jgi:hypothetical protein
LYFGIVADFDCWLGDARHKASQSAAAKRIGLNSLGSVLLQSMRQQQGLPVGKHSYPLYGDSLLGLLLRTMPLQNIEAEKCMRNDTSSARQTMLHELRREHTKHTYSPNTSEVEI